METIAPPPRPSSRRSLGQVCGDRARGPGGAALSGPRPGLAGHQQRPHHRKPVSRHFDAPRRHCRSGSRPRVSFAGVGVLASQRDCARLRRRFTPQPVDELRKALSPRRPPGCGIPTAARRKSLPHPVGGAQRQPRACVVRALQGGRCEARSATDRPSHRGGVDRRLGQGNRSANLHPDHRLVV